MENILIQTEASLKELIKDAVSEALREAPIKPPEKYLTRTEIAKKLHVSTVSIDKAIDDGRLKSYRLNGRILFKESEIDLQPVKFRRKNTV